MSKRAFFLDTLNIFTNRDIAGSGPPPVPNKPDAIKNLNSKKRQDELEQRHQELLHRQKQLQVHLKEL